MRFLLVFVGLVVVAALGLGGAVLWWSGATLGGDSVALARVEVQPLGGSLVSAKAFGPGGAPIPLAVGGGRLVPQTKLVPGEQVSVTVVVRRPGWLRWALGSTRTERLTVQTPVTKLPQRMADASRRARALHVRFADPVDRVSYLIGKRRQIVPVGGQRVVSLGPQAASGTTQVASAARSWERLGPPVRVTWFPQSQLPVVLVSPAVGRPISPLTPIRLTFSRPVSKALGSARPQFTAGVQGSWRETDSHTLLFTPSGFGFPLDSNLRLQLPPGLSVSVGASSAASTRTVAWTVAGASFLRLQQLLAERGLPAGRLAADRRSRSRNSAGRRSTRRSARRPGRSRGATRTRRPSCRASGQPGSRTRSRAAR